MRVVLFLFLSLIITACGSRSIPPEIISLHTPLKAPLITPKNEMIIVDAGHGGKDAGTSSKREKYEEKALTLKTALLVCASLKKLGYKTELTRDNDIFVPLDTRAEIANELMADLFVSIHYNHSPSSEAHGIEVYYSKEDKQQLPARLAQSKLLGQEVLKSLIKATGAESRGVKQANFVVVRKTKMPAILIEAGFLSNPQEREKLHTQTYLNSLADGIASGVDHFLAATR